MLPSEAEEAAPAAEAAASTTEAGAGPVREHASDAAADASDPPPAKRLRAVSSGDGSGDVSGDGRGDWNGARNDDARDPSTRSPSDAQTDDALLDRWVLAKREKDWMTADKIRDSLRAKGTYIFIYTHTLSHFEPLTLNLLTL